MKKITEILTPSSTIIISIIASGNLLLGLASYWDEQAKTVCFFNAIYDNATQKKTEECLLNAGLFDSGPVMWILVEFLLIFMSIVIASIIETWNKKRKT